jgi:hypothetical protein
MMSCKTVQMMSSDGYLSSWVAPVVLAQQRPGEAGAVQLGQRGQEIALAVVGGRRRRVLVRGIDRDRRQLPLVADHHDVAGTRHRQSGQQEVDLRRLIDDEVVEQVPSAMLARSE